MKKNSLDGEYWQNRYLNQKTGWDLNAVSTPIKKYIDQITDQNLKILIPGAGNAHEAEYLFNLGFKHTYVLDIAKQPLHNLKKRVPNFPEEHCLHMSFFDLEDTFDMIIEQTFFCALHPSQRQAYVSKMFNILNDNGKLSGLLFDFELTEQGPPFGGNKLMYQSLFKDKFRIKTLERAYNSISTRQDKELFFIFEKKGQ